MGTKQYCFVRVTTIRRSLPNVQVSGAEANRGGEGCSLVFKTGIDQVDVHAAGLGTPRTGR